VIVFGLILVLLAIGAGVALFLATQSLTTPVDLELAGYSWGMTPLALVATGAAALLILWIGLAMIRGSVKRRRRPAREAKEAERQAKLEESIRADERSRADETHQSALAERDRVREEEFQARLADHDRENEERIRAEERRRVEQEHSSRTTAVGAGTADAGRHASAESADSPESADSADSADRSASDDRAEGGSSQPGYRTVADKVMGREPVEND
jgi:flagellar biosynthesis/type III secretory pathway M-ring protein FliF/YscJ